MFNLDPAKILVIGMIALVVLGPERLPKVARQLGHAWRELTRLRDQVSDEVRSAFPVEEIPRIPSISSAVTTAVESVTRPTGRAGQKEPKDAAAREPHPSNISATRRAPEVIVHPSLGEFAFLPDDPSMN